VIVSVQDLMSVARPALERGQRVRMVAKGSSMLPFIRSGDVVELTSTEMGPARGDVVVAQTAPGRYVIHRVVRVAGEGVWLRGDSQRRAEGPVVPGEVFGRVAAVERSGRRWRLDRGVWRLSGWAWMTTHPVGLAALWVSLSIWKLVRRQGSDDPVKGPEPQ